MKIKICTKCGDEKDIEEFGFRDQGKGTRRSDCLKCYAELKAEHYKKNKATYLSHQQKARDRNREFIKSYLSDKSCVDCGNDDWRLLEFDHIGEKVGNISRLAFTRKFSIDKLLLEMEKCEIRCANCHRLVSYARQGSYKE